MIVFLFCGLLCTTNHVDNDSASSSTPYSPPLPPSSTKPPPVNTVCFSNEFQCRDGGCINSYYRCDNINDCADKSDEFDCGKYATHRHAVVAPSLLETRFFVRRRDEQ